MRWLLLTFVAVAGCFTEPETSPETCVDGQAGCDCDAGTCEAELECVASIDKCVPTDCTPGERTCTCADGDVCLGGLECRGGVCLAPQAGTTGNMTTSVPTTSSDASSSITSAGPTTEMTSDTEPGTTSSGSSESDGSTASTSTSASETVQADCDVCVQAAYANECPICMSSPGCDEIYQCVFTMGASYESCCAAEGTSAADAWNIFIGCAMVTEACMGQCEWLCTP